MKIQLTEEERDFLEWLCKNSLSVLKTDCDTSVVTQDDWDKLNILILKLSPIRIDENGKIQKNYGME